MADKTAGIGERLRALREGAKLSQTKVAEYAGTNQSSVNRYESGRTAPPLETLLWYAEFFDVSLDYIFGRAASRHSVVRDVILESARKRPELTAYMYKEARTAPYISVSYREFIDDVSALGARLFEMGLSGGRIAVIGDNCYSWALAYFAALFGAGAVVPLDKELRSDEIKYLLTYASCGAVFYTERFDETLADFDEVKIRVRMNVYAGAENPEGVLTLRGLIDEGAALPQEKRDAFLCTPIDENAMAALLFTSGTTGSAKGVMLSNRGMAENIRDMSVAHNVKPGGATVSVLPMHHCFEAVMGQQFMLANGAAIAIGDGLKYLRKNMEEVKPTVMLFVPLLLENFYGKIINEAYARGKDTDLRRRVNDYLKLRTELGANDDEKARLIARGMFAEEQALFGGRLDSIFTGAAAINPKVIQGLQEIGIKVTYGYGMTECGPLMTATPYFSDTMGKSGSVGTAVPSGAMRIEGADERGVGEICYRGATVMLGYYERPEETADVMRGGWFHSGDLGLIDDDGWLYITGRETNIIVTKTGKNVFPEELEAVLARHPYIGEIMVYAAEDKKRGGPLISAIIRPDYGAIETALGADAAADAGGVVELLREAVGAFNAGVANYKRIRHISVRRHELVKTPTKKIMRSRNV